MRGPRSTDDPGVVRGGEAGGEPPSGPSIRVHGALQPDGKILLAGSAMSATGNRMAVARLLPGGAPDATFDGDGKRTIALADNAVGNGIAVQADGRIVVAGSAGSGFSGDFLVARLLPGGALDSSFAGDGLATVPFDLGGSNDDAGRGLALQPDGKIVFAGQIANAAGDYDFGSARHMSDGALDGSFGTGGKTVVAFDLGDSNVDLAEAVALRPDSRILIAGTVQRSVPGDRDFGLVQLLVDQVFADGFESGGLSAWSGVVP
jgi:uncharacterized delta-60 repeat protein